MKNLKCFVGTLVFAVLIFLIIPHNLFAIVPKFNPVKSVTEEALSLFLMAEDEFKKGQGLQGNHNYENAITCYIKSLRSWYSDETLLNLTYCFCKIKLFFTAEKMALLGIQTAMKNKDFVSYIKFLVLLGGIYYEIENYEKALVVYKHISSFSMDKDSRNFINLKIEDTENNISYYSP